jgi:ADP-L-glycero-D-manno-heptose 6-epimerase
LAALEAKGAGDLVACDVLGTGDKWRNIAKRELAHIVPPPDLFDFLTRHRGKVESIFHLGAISSTTETDGDLIVEQNFRFSMRLWDWCAEARVPLIYASSAATYGDGAQGFVDDDSPDALAQLRPLNAYGWSKHAFDRRVARLAANGAATPPHWAGLKFFNVYGPNEYHKGGQRSVVPQIHEQVLQTGKARLFKSHHPDYPDGGQKRDFIWVGDCVDVMLWLAGQPKVNGIFNCGTGAAQSFNDVAVTMLNSCRSAEGRPTLALHELQQQGLLRYVPFPGDLKGKYQSYTQADLSNLRSAGYSGEFRTVEAGVGGYVRELLAARG